MDVHTCVCVYGCMNVLQVCVCVYVVSLSVKYKTSAFSQKEKRTTSSLRCAGDKDSTRTGIEKISKAKCYRFVRGKGVVVVRGDGGGVSGSVRANHPYRKSCLNITNSLSNLTLP